MKSILKGLAVTSIVALSLAGPAVVLYRYNQVDTSHRVIVVGSPEKVHVPPTLDAEGKRQVVVKSVEVGELVHLSVDGDHAAWEVIPYVPDSVVYGEKDEMLVISFRKDGLYTVVVGVATGNKVSLRQIELKVGQPPKPDIPPPPLPPNVLPNSAWDAKIEAWLGNDLAKKPGAIKLGESFASVAGLVSAKISKGELVTVDEIIALTVQQNQLALAGDLSDWTQFRQKLNAELQAIARAGGLSTMKQHIDTWTDIAHALKTWGGK